MHGLIVQINVIRGQKDLWISAIGDPYHSCSILVKMTKVIRINN